MIAKMSQPFSEPVWAFLGLVFTSGALFGVDGGIVTCNPTALPPAAVLPGRIPPLRFADFVRSYGVLETAAGSGLGRTDGVSFWQPAFEGGPATSAALSRPHYAMADRAGNIYIADKNSHSILRVDTNGCIHTHAGNHTGGFNGHGPATATALQLNCPNSLWVNGNGVVYVLDTGNGLVRRVDSAGTMATLFKATRKGQALPGGRTLWVSEREDLAYFGAETKIRRWRPGEGVRTVAKGFADLGTFYVAEGGELVVADRGGHYVYRVHSDGSRTVLAGNGTLKGGGDGYRAVETGLNGPRGVWGMPAGGYLILTHDGCQLWFLDIDGRIHLLVNGTTGRTHLGDGTWFYRPQEPRISEGRSVSVDYAGNILLCESDYGYIRRICCERRAPEPTPGSYRTGAAAPREKN